MFTDYLLGKLRTYLKEQISYAKYKIGEEYHRAEIGSAEILADGRVAVTMTFYLPGSAAATVAEVQLYDAAGQLLASKNESIALQPGQDGFFYRFRLSVREQEGENGI